MAGVNGHVNGNEKGGTLVLDGLKPEAADPRARRELAAVPEWPPRPVGAALPVAIEPLQVVGIALAAMAIALLSTLYPSWRAAATQPAEALRYE